MVTQPGGEILLYEAKDGAVRVEVRLERETVWLTQRQMAELFGRERSVITRHLGNVFREGELDEQSNVQNIHIAGSNKPVKFYNLDVIISLGYRVKSPAGNRFRQWATRTLREHLVRGYTINRQRFERNAQELEAALILMRTFLLLQRYDEGLLVEPKGESGAAYYRLSARPWLPSGGSSRT
jgi:hypothetical protein